MNIEKNKTTNDTNKRKLPEGILCDGYCHECCYCVRSKYDFSDWWCNYHDRSTSLNEYHACCES